MFRTFASYEKLNTSRPDARLEVSWSLAKREGYVPPSLEVAIESGASSGAPFSLVGILLWCPLLATLETAWCSADGLAERRLAGSDTALRSCVHPRFPPAKLFFQVGRWLNGNGNSPHHWK